MELLYQTMGVVAAPDTYNNFYHLNTTYQSTAANPTYGSFTYGNGGSESPLLIHRDGILERLPTTGGSALGSTRPDTFEEKTILLAPGDTVICCTDGAAVSEDDAGERFGQGWLARPFEEQVPYGAVEAVDMVYSSIAEFAQGTRRTDDITCLALYRT